MLLFIAFGNYFLLSKGGKVRCFNLFFDCSRGGGAPIHIICALQFAVQEAGGCLTTKMAPQWEALFSQGEAVFVDFFHF